MARVELIKNKLESAANLHKKQTEIEQKFRITIRNLLLEIEWLGGWVELGYERAMDFYRQEFNKFYVHAGNQISLQSASKDYELVVGVPVGHYPVEDFAGLRVKRLTYNPAKGKGPMCSLDQARMVREKWNLICKESWLSRLKFLLKTDPDQLFYLSALLAFPSGDEIYRFSGSSLKKQKEMRKLNVSKISKLKEENEKLQKEVQRLTKEVERLQRLLNQVNTTNLRAL